MVANSLYSLLWDIEFDWGMPWLLQPGENNKAYHTLQIVTYPSFWQPCHLECTSSQLGG